MHLKQKLQNYIHHIIFLIIVCIFVVINHVPSGTVIASGDFYQLLDPIHNVSRYLYMWLTQHGQGAFNYLTPSWPYYMIIWFIDRLGGSISTQATFTMTLLVVGSYITAWWATGLFVSTKRTRWILSIFYACNSVIFSFFFYSWWYVHHFLIYIFLPPLILLFIKFLMDEKNRDKHTYLLILRFIVATVWFNNIGFLAVIILCYFLLGIVFLLLGIIRINANFIKNICTFAIACFFAFGRYALAFYLSQDFFSSKIASSRIFGGDITHIISATSNTIFNSLRLYIGNYFNTQLFWFQLVYPLCLLPGFILIKNKYKPFIGLLIVFGIFIVLATRLGSFFTPLNAFLFDFSFFQLFRSPDKIFIMLPVLYLALYTILYAHPLIQKTQARFVLVWVLICILPFLGNHIKQEFMKESIDNPSIAVRVPISYTDIIDVIHEDKRSVGILSLPNVATTSLNRANYPVRWLVWADLLHTLYNKPYFSANSYDHPILETRMSLSDIGAEDARPQNLINAIQDFGAWYIILHRSVPPSVFSGLQKTTSILQTAVDAQLIDLLYDSLLFSLYAVNRNFVQASMWSSWWNLYFYKHNPVLYQWIIIGSWNVDIILRQAFDTQRRFLIIDNNDSFIDHCQSLEQYIQGKHSVYECLGMRWGFHLGNIIRWLFHRSDIVHTMYKTYSNMWSINNTSENTIHFYVFYMPQLFLYFGILCQITLFVWIVYVLKK